MITIENIRNKIIENIKTSGLTQAEICKRLGIKTPTMSQYLSGRAMPALDTFANLCAILDLDANEILCLTDSNRRAVNISNSFNNVSNSHIKVGK